MNTVTPLNPSSPLPAALTRLQPWRSGVALALDWALIGASLAVLAAAAVVLDACTACSAAAK